MKGIDIKNYRIKKGLTQEELGTILGLTRKTINSYETKGNIPTDKQKIFNFLFSKENNNILLIKNGVEITADEIALFVVDNEETFMKIKPFSNLIEIKVAKRLVELTNDMQKLKDFLKH